MRGKTGWNDIKNFLRITVDDGDLAFIPQNDAEMPSRSRITMLARPCALVFLLCSPFLTSAPSKAEQKHSIPTAPTEFLAKKNPISADQVDAKFMKKTARLYRRKCRSCHGVNGDGNGSKAEFFQIKPAAFSKPGYLEKRKDGQLFWIMMNGSPDTEMEGKGPGTRDNLSERELWSLILYLRKTFTR
jgi:mono/diheme cytochrome c family protein